MKTIVLCLFICLLGSIRQSQCSENVKHPKEHVILVLLKSWVKEEADLEKNHISSIVFPNSEITDIILFSEDDKKVDDQEFLNTSKTNNDQTRNSVSLSATVHNNSYERQDNKHNMSYYNSNKDLFIKEKNTVICTKNNERFAISNKCDSYIECQNGIAEEKQCPDGLRYNHNSKSDSTPCLYPAEIDCKEGATLQTPKPTKDCPHQFGYFKTEDVYNCSSFRICENGTGYDYICPDGLAFNNKNYRCDWPDKVPQCNVEELFEFQCPEIARKQGVSKGYRSLADCNTYFICMDGKPRRLECSEYFAFDQQTQKCIPANEVEECTTNQKNGARSFVRKSNGEYIIRKYDDYMYDRFGDIKFSPNIRYKAKIIS